MSGTDPLGRTVVNDAVVVVSLVTPDPDVLGVAVTKPAPQPPLTEVEDAVLPRTGSEIRTGAFVALALLGLGVFFLFAARCRRTGRRAL